MNTDEQRARDAELLLDRKMSVETYLARNVPSHAPAQQQQRAAFEREQRIGDWLFVGTLIAFALTIMFLAAFCSPQMPFTR
jgi:hypothetical protein